MSFGALAVAAGLSIWQAQLLSLADVHRRLAVRLRRHHRRRRPGRGPRGDRDGVDARHPQRALRAADLALPRVTGRAPVVAAQLTIDESTAVGIAQPEPAAQRLGFWQTGIAVFVLWNLSTLAGALLGNAFGDPRTLGLDAAAAAAFVALLWPRLRSRDATATAVLADRSSRC